MSPAEESKLDQQIKARALEFAAQQLDAGAISARLNNLYFLTPQERLAYAAEAIMSLQATAVEPTPYKNGHTPPETMATAAQVIDAPTWETPAHDVIDYATVDINDLFIDSDLVQAVEESRRVAAIVEKVSNMTLEDWAHDAINRGFYVFPCVPGGKRPAGDVVPNGVLDASNDHAVIARWWAVNPNFNPAIALEPSNLVVWDYDIIAPFSNMPPTLRIRSGRILKDGEEGGFHDYYRGSCKTRTLYVEPVQPTVVKQILNPKSGKLEDKIYDAFGRFVTVKGVAVGEVRSRGAYVVYAGAVHSSGHRYTIVQDLLIADSPEQNTEPVINEAAVGTDQQQEIARYVEDAFTKGGIDYESRTTHKHAGGGFRWLISCPWKDEHTGGKDFDTSSAVIMYASGKLIYECKHAHCDGIHEWKEVRAEMEKHAGHSLQFGPSATPLILSSLEPTTASAPAQPTEWPTIAPLDDELFPVLSFSVDFLPAAIVPWVTDVSERMAVPLDYAGICALVVASGVIARRAFIFPKANDKEWKEAICLSGAVVASSGRTKTPTWKTFTNPVIEVEKDWQRDHEFLVAQYKQALAAWQQTQKANKAALKANKNAAITESPKPEPPPDQRRLMLNDATPEKMHDIMKENPSGLFYYRDELASWVVELDKVGRETQRGLFLSAMNGNDNYAVDRIGRIGGHALMSATVFGSFQPDILREFLSESRNIADGLVPRFPLLVWPNEVRLPKVDRLPDTDAKQTFRHIIRVAANMAPDTIMLHFTPEAQKLFYEFIEDNDSKIEAETNTGKQSHLSKYSGGIAKIAGLFQIIDLIAQGGTYSGAYKVDTDHFIKAQKFLRYLESHMHRIYDSKLDPVQQAESIIGRGLKKKEIPDGFTARDIQRKRWVKDLNTINDALFGLVDKGWIRPRPSVVGIQGGRPTVFWDINPAMI